MPKFTIKDLQVIKEERTVSVAVRRGHDGDPLTPGMGDTRHLLLCSGTGCQATGSARVKDALLEEIKRSSQIIMVTHSRKTMAITDRLFGITMENKGVSKLVSVDIQRLQSQFAANN